MAHWAAHWNERAAVADPVAAVGYSGLDAALYRQLVLEPLLARIAPAPGKRVLDVGCGTGLLLLELERLGVDAVGVDISAAMAARYPGRAPVIVGDALSLPDDLGRFGAIVLNSVAHYFPSRRYFRAVVRRCAERLLPGGRLIVGDLLIEDRWRRRPDLYLHFRPAPLRRFLDRLGLPYEIADQSEAKRCFNRRFDLIVRRP